MADLREKLKEVTKENLKISYSIEETKRKNDKESNLIRKSPSLQSKYSISTLSLHVPLSLIYSLMTKKLNVILC